MPMVTAPGLPENYPRALDRTVTLADGQLVHLRPIHPGDAPALVAFHARLSSDSVYRRYFSFHPELSETEVTWLTTVDYVDRLALVVVVDDALVAVGRYDRLPGTETAEVAFLVADEFQHRGLGMLLLKDLATAARRHAITTFVAETQASNRDMMGVFEGSGFNVTSSLDAEIISVRFRIAPYEASDHGESVPGTA
ncbi:MAG TPA: GNAT family N-acetyltransferase [Acidimicrobiales bacterium]|nr:GNAT family N-acetyltransferase [Acidimicrobiales bacterium]